MNSRIFVILTFLSIAIAFASNSRADETTKSWVGRTVLPTKPNKDITFGDWVDGKQVYFPLKTLELIVLEDHERWLRIYDGHRKGRVDKSDVVLAADAPAYFHRRIEADATDSWALYMLGVGWLGKGEPDKAIKDLDNYIHLNPSDSMGFKARGNAYMDKKQYDKAIKDYDEAIRLDPKYVLAFYNRGNAYLDKKDYDKAITDYNEVIHLDTKSPLAFYNRGITYQQKKEYDKAIKDYDEVIRLDPKYSSAFYNRGNAYLDKKEDDKAIKDYDEAIRLGLKYASAFNNRGLAYSHKKEYDKAIKNYDEAIRLDPKYTFAFNNKAYILATCADDRHRDVTKAEELVRTVIMLRPTSPYNDETLGVIAAAKGQFDDAINYQKKALEDSDYADKEGDKARERLKVYEGKKACRE